MIIAAAIKPQMIHLMQIRQKHEVRAFLDVIAHAEGTDTSDGYYTIYGSSNKAKSLSDHPGRRICEKSRGKKLCSTAAGRYQFLHTTWDELAARFGFKDFGCINQDLAAIALLHDKGAIEDIERHDIYAALKKACRIWASLPGSPYGQPTRPIEEIIHVFNERYTAYKNGVNK